eukprot:6969325-Prorocentrum_lima.AAC.1
MEDILRPLDSDDLRMLMEVFAPTTGTGVGHALSSIEALSTLPQLPPTPQDQWKVMNWIDSLPRGARRGVPKDQEALCLAS